jgi:DNA repair photolyase
MEPRATAPARRVQAIERLATAGIPVGVLFAPVIPALNDHEMEAVLEACHAAGARSAAYVFLRLPLEVASLFEDWLRLHYPMKAEHVLSLIAQTRGGRRNDPRFGARMRGEGVYAELISKRFSVAVQRLGLNRAAPVLNTTTFRRPRADESQYVLF